jgi:hypothetical protein
MMPEPTGPDRQSRQGLAAATLTAVLVIEHSSEASRDALVSLLLSTAWPTPRAQNQ